MDSLFSLPSVELKGVRQVNENIMKWSPRKYAFLTNVTSTSHFILSLCNNLVCPFQSSLNVFAQIDAKRSFTFKYTLKTAKHLFYYIFMECICGLIYMRFFVLKFLFCMATCLLQSGS